MNALLLRVFLALAYLLLATHAQAQPVYLFQPDSARSSIGEIGLLPNCDTALSLAEVQNRAFDYGKNPTYTKGCRHWIKLRVFIPDSLEGQYLIEQPYNKKITHYYYPNSTGSYVHTQSGIDTPPSERGFNFPRYTRALIHLQGGDTSTVYVYFDRSIAGEGVEVELYLIPYTEQIRAEEAAEYHILLMSMALLGLLSLYNAFIYFYTKERSYLYYALTFFSFAAHISTIQDYYLMWTAYIGDFWDYVLLGCVAVGFSMYFIFSLFYLKGTDYLPKLRKRVTWVIRICIFLELAFALGQFILSRPNLILISYVANAGIVVGIFTLLFYAIRLSQKGQKTAQYYIYASLATLPFVCLYFAQGSDLTHRGHLGLIPSSTLTRMSLPVGIVAQALAFSLALGARINIMRKDIAEKEAERERLKRERLLEINRLAERQKEELEATVRERTQSLLEANEELRISEERLEELNKTKDHFFAVLAHDLRGPIGSFQDISQTLQYQIKKGNIERLNQIMAQIDKSSTHLNILLDNLLQWAQSQLGGMSFHPKPVPLKAIIMEVEDIYSGMAQSKGIRVSTQIEPEDLLLWVDEPSTATIIRNIWGNAMKYTEQGSLALKAYPKGNYALISIADTGKGIAPEKLRAIFDIDQAKVERGTRGEKGNGLGLALCHDFTLKNKGEIWIESEMGRGTTVHLRLPAIKE